MLNASQNIAKKKDILEVSKNDIQKCKKKKKERKWQFEPGRHFFYLLSKKNSLVVY